MLLFGCLTQAASESNFRKLSAAGAMATPTRAQKCQSLRISLLRFAVNSCINVHKWVHYTHTTHARFENWHGQGMYFCKTGLSLISNHGCMSPMHVSSGIHSGSAVTFLLPGLFCSRCLRSLQKSLSTKEAMVTSYRHSGGDCEQPSGQHKA